MQMKHVIGTKMLMDWSYVDQCEVFTEEIHVKSTGGPVQGAKDFVEARNAEVDEEPHIVLLKVYQQRITHKVLYKNTKG